MLLSVCATMALSVNFLGSCSADDEDVYYGDELKTRAKATRSASGEPETGGGDDTVVYDYKIADGSGSARSYISQAEDFYATVTFKWQGGNTRADNAHATTSVSVNIPNKIFAYGAGTYISVSKYYVVNNTCSNTQFIVHDGFGKSYFITDLTVEYKEILYTTQGEFYGYGTTRTHNESVSLDVTDKVIPYIAADY